MTNPVRLLALLNADSQDLTGTGHGSGGAPSQAQALAAAHTAGMPRHWYLMARWKWVGDPSVVRELFDRAEQAARTACNRGRGPELEAATITSFVELALAEIAWPGKFRDPGSRQAWIGVAKSSWSRQRRQYEPIYRELDGWASGAYGFLLARQRPY
jgi:hypothetical protein